MKMIVFSDLHGNYEALARMLEIEQPTSEDLLVFCGDIVGYYYDALKIVNKLRELSNIYAIRGNHDQYYIDSTEDRRLELRGKYGISHLNPKIEIIEYIKQLPIHIELNIEQKSILICHGSNADYLEGRVYPDTEIIETKYDLIISGHTHYQMDRREGKTLYLNPGSLGQPRDKKGFSYCVVEIDDSIEYTFKKVEINIKALQKQCLENEGEITFAYKVLEREL